MATRLLHTVKPSGGDFTTLYAAIEHLKSSHPNLVTADVYADIEIDGTWSAADTSAVSISDIVTDSTHYINIYTTTAARHKGIYSLNYYMIDVNSYLAVPITSGIQYVTFNGLQIIHGNYANSLAAFSNNTIKNCLITGASYSGLYVRDVSNIIAYNNIIYNCGDYGIYGDPDGANNYTFYNNTIYGCNKGIQCADSYNRGTIIIRNNLCIGNTTDYGINLTYTESFTNNGSSDTTGTAGLTSLVAATEFVDPTGTPPDFHLKAGATSIDAGVDLSGTFTEDIDEQTRFFGAAWDIGADELKSITYSKEDKATLPADDANLSSIFTAENYTDVSSDNGVYVVQSSVGQYSVFVLKNNNNTQIPFTVTWNGKSDLAPTSSTVYLQIYNRNSATWETLASNNSANANTDFTLTETKSTNLSYYYDANGWVACRVYQQAV